jgi:serine/threonine protein kinase
MNSLDFDSLNVPVEIRTSLKELSDNISIQKYCPIGANGYLFFGHNKILDKKVAIKYYYWGGEKKYHAEPKRLSVIKSDNVIEIFHAEMIDNEWAFFITPYCQQGDLDTLLAKEKISVCESVDILLQVLNGLSHLHGSSLVHRDLKPANIFFTDQRKAVIGDFGSVKKVPNGDGAVPGSGHSVLYRPLESITIGKYGYSGDIYQLGIVLYQNGSNLNQLLWQNCIF